MLSSSRAPHKDLAARGRSWVLTRSHIFTVWVRHIFSVLLYIVSCSHVEHELTDRLSLVVSSSWRWQLWWTYKCYIIFKCLVRELNIAEISRAMLRVASLKTSDLCGYVCKSSCVGLTLPSRSNITYHTLINCNTFMYVFWKIWWPWPLMCWPLNNMASCSSQGNLCAECELSLTFDCIVGTYRRKWDRRTRGRTDRVRCLR